MTKQKFYIVDDYTDQPIWDAFLLTEMPYLPTRPKGWQAPAPDEPRKIINSLSEGDWTISHALYQLAADGAYLEAQIPKPTLQQLPVIFCVTTSSIEKREQVTAKEAADFIAARIA